MSPGKLTYLIDCAARLATESTQNHPRDGQIVGPRIVADVTPDYSQPLAGIVALLEEGRRVAVRYVNAVLTTTYWLVGRGLVEHEQAGKSRADYGSQLLKRLSRDLQSHYVRLLSVLEPEARRHYEAEAIRGDWSVRQLDRQISTLAYQRSRSSKGGARPMMKYKQQLVSPKI
jgi:hypothetical protein